MLREESPMRGTWLSSLALVLGGLAPAALGAEDPWRVPSTAPVPAAQLDRPIARTGAEESPDAGVLSVTLERPVPLRGAVVDPQVKPTAFSSAPGSLLP